MTAGTRHLELARHGRGRHRDLPTPTLSPEASTIEKKIEVEVGEVEVEVTAAGEVDLEVGEVEVEVTAAGEVDLEVGEVEVDGRGRHCAGRTQAAGRGLVGRGGPGAGEKVLASHGAAKVSAYVTHAVFPKQSYERFMASNSAGPGDQFAYFWITDSCPHTVKAIGQRPPFEVLSLAGSIADALQI